MLNKWRRLFHSSRVTLPLVKMSASWCLVWKYRICIIESRLILPNNQSKATLWVLDTCLILGLRAFDYHFNHNFNILKDIQHSSGTRMCSAWWNVINVGQIRIGVRGWNSFSHVWLRSYQQISPWLSLGSICVVRNGMKHINHQLPKIESGNLIHEKTCIERNDSSFCRSVWNRSLFSCTSDLLAQTCDVVFQVSCKIRVLKQS